MVVYTEYEKKCYERKLTEVPISAEHSYGRSPSTAPMKQEGWNIEFTLA